MKKFLCLTVLCSFGNISLADEVNFQAPIFLDPKSQAVDDLCNVQWLKEVMEKEKKGESKLSVLCMSWSSLKQTNNDLHKAQLLVESDLKDVRDILIKHLINQDKHKQ